MNRNWKLVGRQLPPRYNNSTYRVYFARRRPTSMDSSRLFSSFSCRWIQNSNNNNKDDGSSHLRGGRRRHTIHHQTRPFDTLYSICPTISNSFSDPRYCSSRRWISEIVSTSTTNIDNTETTTNAKKTKATSTTLDSIWEQKTHRLLYDVPLGSMTAKEWGEAHACILHWLDIGGRYSEDEGGVNKNNINSNSNKKSANRDDENTIRVLNGIVYSLDLIDRLFKEEHQILISQSDVDDGDDNNKTNIDRLNVVPTFFNTELLNLILNRWRQNTGQLTNPKMKSSSVTSSVSTTQHFEGESLQPQRLLSMLYRYQEQSSFIQPNVQSFGMLMDGIASMVSDATSSMNATERKKIVNMVNEIIDRLVDDAISDEELFTVNSTTAEMDAQEDMSFHRHRIMKKLPPKPNVFVFSAAMNVWVKSAFPEAPEQVEKLLNQMKDLAERYPTGWRRTDKSMNSLNADDNSEKGNSDDQSAQTIAPNRISYSTAIDTWAKVGRVDKVKELLQEMNQSDDDDLQPGLHAFNGLLVALSSNGLSDEAEAVLDQIEEMYESGDLEDAPNEFAYTTVLDSFCRSKNRGAAQSADALFRRMKDVGIQPSVVTYNAVLNAHVKAGNMNAAESLLQEMQADAALTRNMDLKPTVHTYSTLLSGIANSGHNDAGRQAERILDHLQHLSNTGELDTALDTTIYNVVLDAIAKSSYHGTADHAKNILERMRGDGVARDVITYNTLMHCLAKTGSHDAEKMLDIMEEDGVPRNATTYNTLLVSYLSSTALPKSRSRTNHKTRREQQNVLVQSTQKAERLFTRIKNDPTVDLDIVSYNTMLHFYALGGDAHKARALLDEIKDSSLVKPDTITFNTVINAYGNSFRLRDGPEQAESLLHQMISKDGLAPSPNTITFNSVMGAWVKSRRPEAAQCCEKLFHVMKDAPFDCDPDAVTFNTLIHSLASAPENDSAPDRAETIFAEMKQRNENGEYWLRPTILTNGSMIAVWSRCKNRPESGEKAELYLRQIIRNSRKHQEKAKPRVYEFISTIRAWQNSGHPKAPYKADEIFGLLLQEYETQNNKQARPTEKLFEAILSTIASSRHVPNKPAAADKILYWMKKYNIAPNDTLVTELGKCYREMKATKME
jgi:pentatricopeptide repeat protein